MDRREHSFNTLSGVPCTVAELMGMHQRFLSETRYQKNGKGFDLLLKDCIVSLGGKRNLNEEDINQLFSADRKHILLELRHFSLNYQKEFAFDYEWPMENGSPQKQQYAVNFTPEDFPVKPFEWVREKYEAAIEEERLRLEAQGRMFTEADRAAVPIPTVCETYAEALEHKEYIVELPRLKKPVRMEILSGVGETAALKIPDENRSTHTPLLLRKPNYMENQNGVERPFLVNLDRMFLEDITALRRAYKRIEGDVDTQMVIKNQLNEAQTVRVNLIALTDFFFPSVVG